MNKLDQKQLRELFDYNVDAGLLFWKVSTKNHVRAGTVAGYIRSDGYRMIEFGENQVLAHRMIWCWHHGYDSENMIDHINRSRNDNRIENLREVVRQCNLRNTGNRKDNRSGVKGVCWNKGCKKWRVDIGVDGKTHYLGLFNDFDEAVLIRLAVEQCLNWSDCDLSSPAYQYAIDRNLINRGG